MLSWVVIKYIPSRSIDKRTMKSLYKSKKHFPASSYNHLEYHKNMTVDQKNNRVPPLRGRATEERGTE